MLVVLGVLQLVLPGSCCGGADLDDGFGFGPQSARMKVRVRLFASLRESVGRERLELELPDGASVEEAWRRLASQHPSLEARRPSLAAAVNRSYATFESILDEGDELAFIPPVSGG